MEKNQWEIRKEEGDDGRYYLQCGTVEILFDDIKESGNRLHIYYGGRYAASTSKALNCIVNFDEWKKENKEE